MEKFKMKSWMRYLLVFVLLLAVNRLIRECASDEELKDGNLLVNSVIAAIPTIIFIIIDRYRLKKGRIAQSLFENSRNTKPGSPRQAYGISKK